MIDWLYYCCVNIFKTFEIFLAEPLSIIRKRIIHILHVETNIFANSTPMEFDVNDKSAQITVYNNKKMYNILSTVIYKRKMQKQQDMASVQKLDMLWERKALPYSLDEDIKEEEPVWQ